MKPPKRPITLTIQQLEKLAKKRGVMPYQIIDALVNKQCKQQLIKL